MALTPSRASHGSAPSERGVQSRLLRLGLLICFTLLSLAAAGQTYMYLEGPGLGENALPSYGTQGVTSPTNTPGPRQGAATWRDTSGTLWLFGGFYDSAARNDLWKYDPVAGQWTWVRGSNTGNQGGTYGAVGVEDPLNTPGARFGTTTWTDGDGIHWLFGGTGNGSAFNDLWKFNPATENWTWVGGSSSPNQQGAYYSFQTAASGSWPGARYEAASWLDAAGKVWIFGGRGYATTATQGYMNDLWKYDPVTGHWAWMKGSDTVGPLSTHGTRGTEDSGNTPGGRYSAYAWTDASGKLWMFGGWAQYGTSSFNYTNELWRFNPGTGNWTWMSGSSSANDSGSYGAQGVEDSANTPGARSAGGAWKDSSGSLWIFGGSASAAYQDLWKYNVSSGNWVWMKGPNGSGGNSTFGTAGEPAPANIPSARYDFGIWDDASGNVTLYAGVGSTGAGNTTYLDETWRFSSGTTEWTFLSGNTALGQLGVYGALGTESSDNRPGARAESGSWTDPSGNFWLFGGTGFLGSSGTGAMNDLWRYNAQTRNWTWMTGSNTASAPGIYGTLGSPDPANTPGARRQPATWTDTSGTLWMFGGNGRGAGVSSGALNDLWKFDRAAVQWTWVKGSNTPNPAAVYGVQVTEDPANMPGGRYAAAEWVDESGNFWIFGGLATSSTRRNDLWKYNRSTGNWTWMKGSSLTNQAGTYGTLGFGASGNTPGSRYNAASWVDSDGNLWLYGGTGNAVSGTGVLSDLWKYDVASGNWIWVAGSNTNASQSPVYGPQGSGSIFNTPGNRQNALSWSDDSGNLWLFGGQGVGTARHNDLWKYQPSTGEWTWVAGSNAADQPGSYGTPGILMNGGPGARIASAGQNGPGNIVYLFGGDGFGAPSPPTKGHLNDVWHLYLNPIGLSEPLVTSAFFSSPSTVDVTFNMAMSHSALAAGNYSISGAGAGTLSPQPDSVVWISGDTYRLVWNSGAKLSNDVVLTVAPTVTDAKGMGVDSNTTILLPVTVSQWSLE